MYSWLSINREYIEDWYDDNGNYNDCAYWYNERASISILAGAIWKRGGLCLSEFASIKAKRNEEKKVVNGLKRKGYTDLYFYIGKKQYIVESKFIMRDNINESDIKRLLNEAILDTEDSLLYEKKENEELRGMALVFVVPTGKGNYIEGNTLEFKHDLFCSLESNLEVDIKANKLIANSCYVIGKEVEI